ncbi:BspA family leucine-rich repeat surface protein [Bifidobacterium sp. ESL0800]|uniref:BspA family leucine-rich repeat surface protein n=1 Tax=Bifidobacterium sp. ESL0800 TaxID=2983236 RepID=UPI0023F7293B|nr:BspA family leucine-rich repeat surface protein [Bifidobacterium sp. ESL0800]WEV75404.1 BspA family leucine-rich repeat surface protein [Bifidobacterium sp. ESL0800]
MRFSGRKLIGIVATAALMCGVVATASAQPVQPVDATSNSVANQQVSTASTQDVVKSDNAQNSDIGKNLNNNDDNNVIGQASKNEAPQDTTKSEQKAPTQNPSAKDGNTANTKSSAAPVPSTQSSQSANSQNATAGPQEVLPTTADCKPYRGGNSAESSAYGSWTLGMKDGQCTLEVTATDPVNEYQFTVIPSTLDDSEPSVAYQRAFIEHVIFNGVGKVKLPASAHGYFDHMMKLSSIDGLDHLDTSAVTDMSSMFEATRVPSLDLSSFDTSSVTNMSDMFYGASAASIQFGPRFVTNKVTDMSSMFARDQALTSLDLSGFDTSNVEYMYYMFHMAEGLTTLKFGANFKTSKVKNMTAMFMFCSKLKSLDVSHFDTHNVTDMAGMFEYCYNLTSLDVSHFDTHNVTDMAGMFKNCSSLTSLDITNFDTSQVGRDSYGVDAGTPRDMNGMFQDCVNLQSLKLGQKFQTGNVKDMGSMFSGCEKLTSLDVSGFDTHKVINMSGMFAVCEDLTSLDVSHFNTRNVTDMTDMFMSDGALTSLDLRNFNMRGVSKVRHMLSIANSDPDQFDLRELKLGDNVVLPTPASTGTWWGDIWLEDPLMSDATWVRVADVNGAAVPEANLSKQYSSLDVEHRTQGSDPSRSGTYVRSDSTKLSVDMNAVGDKKWGTVSDPQKAVGHFKYVQNAQGQDVWQMQFGTLKAPDKTALHVNMSVDNAANSPKYFKFTGWNTSKDGTGTSYAPGQDVPMNNDVTLYAQWKRIGTPGVSMDLHAKYVLDFKMNPPAGSGVTEPAAPDKATSVFQLASSADITKPRAIKIDHQAYPAIDGYRFDGWTINGSTTVYKPGDQVSVVPGVTELKGHWTKLYTYSLKFNANALKGVTGSMPKVDPVGPTADTSHTFTIPANGFVRAGWHFNGWNTKADGTGQSPVSVNGVDTLTLNSNNPAATLYAQWVPEYVYSLSFVSGLPEGTASKAFEAVKGAATTAKSASLKVPAGNKYYREDNQRWQFTGWSDGMGHTYQPGDTVNLTDANPHVVLTGQWVRVYNYNLHFQPTSKNDKAKVSRSFAAVSGGSTTDETVMVTIPSEYGLNLDETGHYMFSGWKDQNGTIYKPGDHVMLKSDNSDVTLYGAWKLAPATPPAGPTSPSATTNPTTLPAATNPNGLVHVAAPALPAVASVASAVSPQSALATAPRGAAPQAMTAAPQIGHDSTPSAPKTSAPKGWRRVECKTSGAAYVVNLAGYRVMASGNVCENPKPAASVALKQHANAPAWLWWIIVAVAVALVYGVYAKRNSSIEAQHRANERQD